MVALIFFVEKHVFVEHPNGYVKSCWRYKKSPQDIEKHPTNSTLKVWYAVRTKHGLCTYFAYTSYILRTSEGEDGRCHGDQREGSFKVSGDGTVPNTCKFKLIFWTS